MSANHVVLGTGAIGRAVAEEPVRRDKVDGQDWHVPNDNPRVTQHEMVMGIEPKMSAMGKAMIWIGGLFIPEAKEQLEMMYEFEDRSLWIQASLKIPLA